MLVPSFPRSPLPTDITSIILSYSGYIRACNTCGRQACNACTVQFRCVCGHSMIQCNACTRRRFCASIQDIIQKRDLLNLIGSLRANTLLSASSSSSEYPQVIEMIRMLQTITPQCRHCQPIENPH